MIWFWHQSFGAWTPRPVRKWKPLWLRAAGLYWHVDDCLGTCWTKSQSWARIVASTPDPRQSMFNGTFCLAEWRTFVTRSARQQFKEKFHTLKARCKLARWGERMNLKMMTMRGSEMSSPRSFAQLNWCSLSCYTWSMFFWKALRSLRDSWSLNTI